MLVKCLCCRENVLVYVATDSLAHGSEGGYISLVEYAKCSRLRHPISPPIFYATETRFSGAAAQPPRQWGWRRPCDTRRRTHGQTERCSLCYCCAGTAVKSTDASTVAFRFPYHHIDILLRDMQHAAAKTFSYSCLCTVLYCYSIADSVVKHNYTSLVPLRTRFRVVRRLCQKGFCLHIAISSLLAGSDNFQRSDDLIQHKERYNAAGCTTARLHITR